MPGLQETEVSRAILDAYHRKFFDAIESDVLIVGAGPAGLTAAIDLCRRGYKVTVFEKRLAIGGGIWGGGMGMNEAVVQDEVLEILDDVGIRHTPAGEGIHTVDTVELSCGMAVKAIQAGATILNLVFVEDVSLREDRVRGVVVNRTMIGGQLPVDPLMLEGKAVVDATGHEAFVVECVRKRGLLTGEAAGAGFGEGPMDVDAGEKFVAERAAEVYPGLWVSGMSVCTTFRGPRMGPIFGGMLLSGRNVAKQIDEAIG